MSIRLQISGKWVMGQSGVGESGDWGYYVGYRHVERIPTQEGEVETSPHN
jgi:hypothetical protein